LVIASGKSQKYRQYNDQDKQDKSEVVNHRSQPTHAAINVFGGRKKFGGLDFNVYIK
jgi:hypothetical protein